ncbi:histidine kinase [Arthrobacter alpinus]|nr:histidine kinase [Arthrobacter alpinus]
MYSDAPSMVGRTFPLPPWSAALFVDGVSQVSLEEQRDADSELESGLGALIEIHVRTQAATRAPLMFEAYFDDEAVAIEHASLILGLTPVILLALATLQLAQLPPAVGLARTIQRNRIARRRLLQHAIVASDLERKRIARGLHDGVIQDLAALSYSLEAQAKHGGAEHRPLLDKSGEILQKNERARCGGDQRTLPSRPREGRAP